MIVVADTTPLRYLVVMGRQEVLPVLFGEIRIPRRVFEELSAGGAPPEVAAFMGDAPAWLRVEDVPAGLVAAIESRLDAGEREALALATTIGADLVVIDDAQGRRAAVALGLGVVGTIGVLRLAVERGLVEAAVVVEELSRTSFYFSEELIRSAFAAWQ